MNCESNRTINNSTKSNPHLDLLRQNFETLQKTFLKLTDKIHLFSNTTTSDLDTEYDRDSSEIHYEVACQVRSKCQDLTCSSGLLFEAVRFVVKQDAELNTLRAELRKLYRENMELKALLSHSLEQIQETHEAIAFALEETEFYKFLRLLDQIEYDKMYLPDDDETWNNSKLYDTQLNIEYASSWFEQLDDFYQKIDENLTDDPKLLVTNLFKSEIKDKATHATLNEYLARHCFDNNDFEICLNLLLEVLNLRLDAYGHEHPIIPATENCLALTYGALKNSTKASDLACTALNKLEKYPLYIKNKSILAHQYTRTGQMLVNWGYLQEGLRLMQSALIFVQNLLPKEEQYWCDLLQRMARTCNDHGYHDDAMALSCEIVDYFHERQHGLISEQNPPIYEVAHQYQLKTSSAKTHHFTSSKIPKPAVLSRVHGNALREIAIAFACRLEFRAAQMIEMYLKMCSKALVFEGDIVLRPNIFHNKLKHHRFVQTQIIKPIRSRSSDRKGLFKHLTSIFRFKR